VQEFTMGDEGEFLERLGAVVPGWMPPAVPVRQVMEGRMCRLEPLDSALHAESLFDANSLDREGRMWTYLPYGPFKSLDGYRAWVGEMSRKLDPMFFVIVDRATGRAVGVASYLRIDPEKGSIEVGHLAYSPLLQRTAAATEAMYLMMERAFSLGYRRYEWKCDALNAASRAAAERLGFTFEGVFRQAAVVKERNRDTAWYSILDKEWPVMGEALQRWLAPGNFDESGRQRVGLREMRG
jgi:RimJ/RimL family protein N-acetyltransferase